jgi:alkaline phosphatase
MRRRRSLHSALVLAVAVAAGAAIAQPAAPLAESVEGVRQVLMARAAMTPSTATARNVILFIGDGMGVSTVTAARIFDGQSRGGAGEENALSFEALPHVALVKTYNSNQQVPDSAGTSTALHSGIKTRAGVIGVGPQARRGDCAGALANAVPTIGELAERNGKATGIVTTSRITHATPAAVYAHSAERDWESDRFMSDDSRAQGCRDIAYQLAHFSVGDGLDVVFGGGRQEFYGAARGGQRRDPKADLIAAWLERAPTRRYISTHAELASLRANEQVLGLFAPSHLAYVAERPAASEQPTLTELTMAAIELLSRHPGGYFLMVEGGRIDHGHHDGKAGYALLETQEFSRAVQAALSRVDLADTLVLVTADHSHTLTIGGYPTRGNPVLGLVVENDAAGEPREEPARAADGRPYATLGYQNGPGALPAGRRRPAPEVGVHSLQQATVPMLDADISGEQSYSETHGGEDVAAYAAGPWSHLVGGVMEQHALFYVITHAFGWQPLTDMRVQ